MLGIEEIEKLSDEELEKVCDVSYSKDPKGKEIKVIAYPKDYEMSEEQVNYIANFMVDNLGEIRHYIDTHQEEYQEWLNEENLKK